MVLNMLDINKSDPGIQSEYPGHDVLVRLAQYAAIIPFIKDKAVLDVTRHAACGLGLMKRAGAHRVIEAVYSGARGAAAMETAGKPTPKGTLIDPAHPGRAFEPSSFDVIVSIEAIGPADDHENYLRALKRVAKPEAVFLVSCSNGFWRQIGVNGDRANRRPKFNFEDFKSTCTKVLGGNVHWGIGAPILGFGTIPIDGPTLPCPREHPKMSAGAIPPILAGNDAPRHLQIENSNYFLGLWNTNGLVPSIAGFNMGMDAYVRASCALGYDSGAGFQSALLHERRERKRLEQCLGERTRELRHTTLRLSAVQSENAVIRRNIAALMKEHTRAHEPAHAMAAIESLS